MEENQLRMEKRFKVSLDLLHGGNELVEGYYKTLEEAKALNKDREARILEKYPLLTGPHIAIYEEVDVVTNGVEVWEITKCEESKCNL